MYAGHGVRRLQTHKGCDSWGWGEKTNNSCKLQSAKKALSDKSPNLDFNWKSTTEQLYYCRYMHAGAALDIDRPVVLRLNRPRTAVSELPVLNLGTSISVATSGRTDQSGPWILSPCSTLALAVARHFLANDSCFWMDLVPLPISQAASVECNQRPIEPSNSVGFSFWLRQNHVSLTKTMLSGAPAPTGSIAATMIPSDLGPRNSSGALSLISTRSP